MRVEYFLIPVFILAAIVLKCLLAGGEEAQSALYIIIFFVAMYFVCSAVCNAVLGGGRRR